MPADAARDADGSARAGNQPQLDLRQSDPCVRSSDDPADEGGQLDAGAHARALEMRFDPVRHRRQDAADAAPQAHDVGGGRVRSGTHLVEVASTAERWPRTLEHHVDRWIGLGDPEGLDELVAHGDGEGVVDGGPVQRDGERVAVALHVHGRAFLAAAFARSPVGPPAFELGPGLEHGVHGGLGDQAVGDRPALAPSQQ